MAIKGTHLSDETKLRLSLANIGKILSEETKMKMSLARKGCKWSPETIKKRAASLWKGGRRMADLRSKARRKRMGFIPLNERFDGSEAHHIDNRFVIFIPKKLHRSIRHSQNEPTTMYPINKRALDWLHEINIDEKGKV